MGKNGMKRIDENVIEQWKNLLAKEPNRLISHIIGEITSGKYMMTSTQDGQVTAFFQFWHACGEPEKSKCYTLLQDFSEGNQIIDPASHPELKDIQDEIETYERELQRLKTECEKQSTPDTTPETEEIRKLRSQLDGLNHAISESDTDFHDERTAIREQLSDYATQLNTEFEQVSKHIREMESVKDMDVASVQPFANKLKEHCEEVIEYLRLSEVFEVSNDGKIKFKGL